MMDFMRDGGASMWLLLASAIATAVIAAAKPRASRPVVLLSGTILVLAEGLFGMAAGMKAVAHNFGRFPDAAAAIGEGLGELANNGVLAAALALLLGIAALVTRSRLPRPAPVSALA